MVGIAEGIALLFLGLVFGILSALFDIVAFGSASFVAHFALWVLVNTFVAIHVDSRLKAIWWAIPLNFGYIESYYLCTSASFEGFPRSLMATLALIALISPLLDYAIWTAKRDKGPYGKILSLLIAGGLVGASYMLFGTYDVFSIVVAAIVLLILWFWPARRLKFTPSVRPADPLEEELAMEASTPRDRPRRRTVTSLPRIEEDPADENSRYGSRSSRNRPTRRRTPSMRRARARQDERERQREREAQRRAAAQRRARRQREREDDVRANRSYPAGVSTLGTSRSPRPSRRSR